MQLDLTPLERAFLDALLASEAPPTWKAALAQQFAALSAIQREHTVVGFYSRLKLNAAVCPQLPGAPADTHWFAAGGCHAEVTGVDLGLTMILWSQGGYIDCIEGVSYGDGADLNPDLFALRPVSIQLN